MTKQMEAVGAPTHTLTQSLIISLTSPECHIDGGATNRQLIGNRLHGERMKAFAQGVTQG